MFAKIALKATMKSPSHHGMPSDDVSLAASGTEGASCGAKLLDLNQLVAQCRRVTSETGIAPGDHSLVLGCGEDVKIAFQN